MFVFVLMSNIWEWNMYSIKSGMNAGQMLTLGRIPAIDAAGDWGTKATNHGIPSGFVQSRYAAHEA